MRATSLCDVNIEHLKVKNHHSEQGGPIEKKKLLKYVKVMI